MSAWIWPLAWTYSLGLLDIFLEYRFLKNMFGAKYRFAFVWLYLGSFLYGHLNQTFVLAGTTLENFIYLSLCGLVLNMLLFHGNKYTVSPVTIGIQKPPSTTVETESSAVLMR